MKPKEFLQKIQAQPESTRKLIVWVVTIIVGLGLLGWWLPRFGQRLRNIQGLGIPEEFSLPKIDLEKKLQNLPGGEPPQ